MYIMLDQTELFRKIELLSFPTIRQKLINLHYNKLFPIKKHAVAVPWSKENFLELYDDIQEIGDNIDSYVTVSKFFITPAYDNLGAHVDNIKINNTNWALNIPILTHQSDHYMIWYEYLNETLLTSGAYNNSLLPKYPEMLVPIDKLILNEPNLVKVGIFHGIENFNSTPRIVLTIRFKKSFEN